MVSLRFLLYISYFFLVLALLQGCAHVVPLTGGEVPKRVPKITYQNPENKAVNVPVNITKLIFKFDTYIKCGNPQQEFFISPPVLPAPDIQVKAKSIEIKLKSPLLPNTCYTIQTNGSIQEYYSSTPLPAQSIVFSTGKQIDTLTLSGIVKDEMQKKLPPLIVCAYQDIPLDSIGKVPPNYTTLLQPDGSFMFKYIRAGNYYLMALKDVNSNYKKDLPNEITALLPTRVSPKDSIKPVLTLLHDAQSPLKVQSTDTLKGAWRITVSKGVLTGQTRLQGHSPVIVQDYKKLYFTDINPKQPLLLYTMDSTGKEQIDTLKMSTVKSKWKDKVAMLKAQILPNEPLIFYSEYPVQWNINTVQVYQDKKNVPLRFDTNAFMLKIYPKKGFWQESSTYQIQNLSQISASTDTSVKAFSITPEKNTGGISGSIKDKKTTDIVYFVSVDNPALRYKVENEKYEFMYLLPGNYQFVAIEDANNDGLWNGGNFDKKELPEKIRYSKVYTIRANWIYEDEAVSIP
jgi:hypothetical protein